MLTCLFRLYSLLDGRSLPVHLVLLELEYFNANVGIFSRIELEINTEINKFNSRSSNLVPRVLSLLWAGLFPISGLIDFFCCRCAGCQPAKVIFRLEARVLNRFCVERGFGVTL